MVMYERYGVTGFVFDFDGTLTHSALDFEYMRSRVMAAVRAIIPEVKDSSLPLLEHTSQLCKNLDKDVAEKVTAVTYATIYDVEIEAAKRSTLFPFVRPLFDLFKEKGLDCSVITRNCPAAVKTVFPDIESYCTCVLTRDDVPNVKPHPDHLVAAVQRMRKIPEEVIMVGDHPMDIAVGKSAGSLTAGVLTGEAQKEDLAAMDPDFIARDVADLMKYIGVCK